jgi:hypothetical protein
MEAEKRRRLQHARWKCQITSVKPLNTS